MDPDESQSNSISNDSITYVAYQWVINSALNIRLLKESNVILLNQTESLTCKCLSKFKKRPFMAAFPFYPFKLIEVP